MKDYRTESLLHFTLAMLAIVGTLVVWVVIHSEKPLSPRELYNLEESDERTR